MLQQSNIKSILGLKAEVLRKRDSWKSNRNQRKWSMPYQLSPISKIRIPWSALKALLITTKEVHSFAHTQAIVLVSLKSVLIHNPARNKLKQMLLRNSILISSITSNLKCLTSKTMTKSSITWRTNRLLRNLQATARSKRILLKKISRYCLSWASWNLKMIRYHKSTITSSDTRTTTASITSKLISLSNMGYSRVWLSSYKEEKTSLFAKEKADPKNKPKNLLSISSVHWSITFIIHWMISELRRIEEICLETFVLINMFCIFFKIKKITWDEGGRRRNMIIHFE